MWKVHIPSIQEEFIEDINNPSIEMGLLPNRDVHKKSPLVEGPTPSYPPLGSFATAFSSSLSNKPYC